MARLVNASDYGRMFNGLPGFSRRNFDHLGPRGLMASMFPNMWMDKVFLFDDFVDDTLNTFHWAVGSDTGTTAFAIPAEGSTVANGVITGSTAADDNEAISIYGSAVWQGDKNCGMAVRWKTDIVANYFFEMGFTDPLTDYTLPAINDIDTPTITNGATTVAVLALDTDQTLQTAGLICDGNATYATSKVNVGTWAPTADNWYTTVIQTDGDDVMLWVYDSNTASAPTLVSGGFQSKVAGFEGGDLVQPWVIFGNRAAANAAAPVIDLICVWQDR